MKKSIVLAPTAAIVLVTGMLLVPSTAQAAPSHDQPAASLVGVDRGVEITNGVSPLTTTHPEGGTWNYGTNGGGNVTYSDYHHPSRKHSSSVRNGSLQWFYSSVTPGGYTSRASVAHTVGGNQAFYKFR